MSCIEVGVSGRSFCRLTRTWPIRLGSEDARAVVASTAPTLFGVDRATVARWQAFWRDYIPQTPFWKLARGRVVPVVEIVVLPLSLLEAFHRTKDPCQDWGHLLRFLSPLTVPSSPLIKMT
jgi:hypothetical protein